MTTERYNPVPFDADATRARWMKRPSFDNFIAFRAAQVA